MRWKPKSAVAERLSPQPHQSEGKKKKYSAAVQRICRLKELLRCKYGDKHEAEERSPGLWKVDKAKLLASLRRVLAKRMAPNRQAGNQTATF